MRTASLCALFLLALSGLVGCDRRSASESEMEELMKKHRPGYGEMQRRKQGNVKGDAQAPPNQAPRRP